MTEDKIATRYKELICAIIAANTRDFLYSKHYSERMKQNFINWVKTSKYFVLIDINIDYFIEQTIKRKEKIERERKEREEKEKRINKETNTSKI